MDTKQPNDLHSVSVGFDNMEWADSDSGGCSGDEALTEPLVSSPSPSPPPQDEQEDAPPPRPAVQLQLLKPPPERFGVSHRRNSVSVPVGLNNMDSPTPSSSPALSMQHSFQTCTPHTKLNDYYILTTTVKLRLQDTDSHSTKDV